MSVAGDGAAALSRLFSHFADHECSDDPLYVAVCRHFAARPDWLALMQHAPATQRVPNLLLAALHDRALAGVAHRFVDYFPSAGGARAPDEALPRVLDDFVAAQRDELVALLATRNTQTNEIGRCAVLWPALCAIAEGAHGRPLALLDFGCSAGLNLGVDRYRYDYGDLALGAPAGPGVPQVACRAVGRGSVALRAFERARLRLADRLGVDPAAVDVADPIQVRWLRACLWPYDRVRAQRFDDAVAIARRERYPVRRCDDCLAAIEPWLDGLPRDVLPVVFNSWVLHYFDQAARQAHVEALRVLVQRRGMVWLSAEGAHLPPPAPHRFEPVGDAAIDDGQVAKGTQWWLTRRGEHGPEATLLARSHAHGRWLQWL